MSSVNINNDAGFWYYENSDVNSQPSVHISETDQQFEKNNVPILWKLEILKFVDNFFTNALFKITDDHKFKETFEAIIENIPFDFAQHILSSKNVIINSYLESFIQVQIIDNIKQLGYYLILNKDSQIIEQLIKNLNEIIELTQKDAFKCQLKDTIGELKTLFESAKNIPSKFPKNTRLERAEKKTAELAKSVLDAISKNKSTIIPISDRNANVISATNEKNEKILFKSYSNSNSSKDIKAVQALAFFMNFNEKAFPPSVSLPFSIPTFLSYKSQPLKLIQQGYDLKDSKLDSNLLTILKSKAGLPDSSGKDSPVELDGFIVPKKRISKKIFSSDWRYVNPHGSSIQNQSFQEIQKLYLLNKLDRRTVRLNDEQKEDELNRNEIEKKLFKALNVGWKVINKNETIAQQFLKMTSLSSFPLESRQLIRSQLSKEVLLQINKISEYEPWDIHAENIGVEIVKDTAYNELNTETYSYTKVIKKTENAGDKKIVKEEEISVKNANLETLHEDYLKRHINENTTINTKDFSQPLKECPKLLETIKKAEYLFVFFDLENAFWYNNHVQRYFLNGKEHFKLPIRIAFEGIHTPFSNEDVEKLKNSLYKDVLTYTWLVENRTTEDWEPKITAYAERLFSRAEMLVLRDSLVLDTNSPDVLLARLERCILSPRAPFSTQERLEHLAHWHTLQKAALHEIQQWRDQLLEATIPSCLTVCKTMYPLLADVIQLIRIVYPNGGDICHRIGHYEYSIDGLIQQSKEILKNNRENDLLNEYIQSFLDPSQPCLGHFDT